LLQVQEVVIQTKTVMQSAYTTTIDQLNTEWHGCNISMHDCFTNVMWWYSEFDWYCQL